MTDLVAAVLLEGASSCDRNDISVSQRVSASSFYSKRECIQCSTVLQTQHVKDSRDCRAAEPSPSDCKRYAHDFSPPTNTELPTPAFSNSFGEFIARRAVFHLRGGLLVGDGARRGLLRLQQHVSSSRRGARPAGGLLTAVLSRTGRAVLVQIAGTVDGLISAARPRASSPEEQC